jgi:hypothetical protein
MAETDGTLTAARRVASIGLATGATDSVIRVPDRAWPRFLDLLTLEHLTGLATVGVRNGLLLAPQRYADDLMSRHREAMVWVLTLERTMLKVTDVLARAGVGSVLLKGPALARCAYPEPSWRPFRDLDLLVRTADWRLACGVLRGLGFRRDLPAPRPGFDERFTGAATFVRPDGMHVDLYRTLAEGPFGMGIDADRLHEQTEVLQVGDRSILRLDDPALVLHAFVYASLGSVPPSLIALRDVLQMASRTVDWRAVAERTRQWRLEAAVAHAWAQATRTLTVVPAPSFLQDLRVRDRDRRSLALYTTDRRKRGGVARGTIGAIQGFEDKASYVRALVLPSREFLTARTGGSSLSSYVRRWMVPVRWASRRRGA